MSEWVSVKDRLPERTGIYLCNVVDSREEHDAEWFDTVVYQKYECKSFKSNWHVADFDEVTHWMPLPEPPR